MKTGGIFTGDFEIFTKYGEAKKALEAGDLTLAEKLFEDLSKSRSEDYYAGLANEEYAHLAEKREDLTLAREQLFRAREIFQAQGDQLSEYRILVHLAFLGYETKDYDETKRWCNRARAMLDMSDPEDRVRAASLSYQQSICATNANLFTEASKYMIDSFEACENDKELGGHLNRKNVIREICNRMPDMREKFEEDWQERLSIPFPFPSLYKADLETESEPEISVDEELSKEPVVSSTLPELFVMIVGLSVLGWAIAQYFIGGFRVPIWTIIYAAFWILMASISPRRLGSHQAHFMRLITYMFLPTIIGLIVILLNWLFGLPANAMWLPLIGGLCAGLTVLAMLAEMDLVLATRGFSLLVPTLLAIFQVWLAVTRLF